jgi:HD-GYP domain-containing protein (c-di-GMP phosphodiesterase class II)
MSSDAPPPSPISENIHITDAQEENIHAFGREHSEKLQALGRTLMSTLYMLIRSVKMYDPDNSIFQKPLASLHDTVTQILTKDGKLELVGVKDSFYLNNMLLKVDMNGLDNVRYLIGELRSKKVGGISLNKSVTPQDLKNFVWIFSQNQFSDPEEDGIEGKKLVNLKVTKWAQLKEKTSADTTNPSAPTHVDRKKYAMTVYARAVFFVRKYMDSLRTERPMDTGRGIRLVQDFVDICVNHRTHFLGMTNLKSESDYLVYHQVNVCLMSILFGTELGLTKTQLLELGHTALFHDAGLACVPQDVLEKKQTLRSEDKAEIARSTLYTIRSIFRAGAISRATLQRVIAIHEHKQDYGTPVRDVHGAIQLILPRSSLGVYARIISICDTYDALTSRRPFREAYEPSAALAFMWSEVRHKFDPELLAVFMKVMAVAPQKSLGGARVLSMNGL